MAAALVDVNLVLGVCGLGANAGRFITSQGITDMDSFAIFRPKDAKDLIKNHNGRYTRADQKLGFAVEKRIRGFLHWYQDKLRRQEPVVAADWTVAAMAIAVRAVDIEDEAGDDDIDIEVGKINTDMGWYKYKEKLWAKLKAKRGISGVPLEYIVAPVKPAGWTIAMAIDDHERLIYSASLAGMEFDKDNKTTWQIIQASCLGTPSYEWIRHLDASQNGRGAAHLLVTMCEGEASQNKRILIANRVISLDQNVGGAIYQDEYVYPFGSYTTKLHEAYATIDRYRNATAPETMVQRMLDGIRVKQCMPITFGKEFVTNNLMGDWLGAIAHMSSKVIEAFPPRSNNKRPGHDGTRRTSEAKRGRGDGRGRGGRGRGGPGRGHGGRGRGRGGRGGGSGFYFNGVDCRDFERNFSAYEFDTMGPEGRRSVHERRRGGGQRGAPRGRGYGQPQFQGRGYGGRGNFDDRNVQQAQIENGREYDGQEPGTRAIVPYNGPNQGNVDHRAAQGRGGRAGNGFGRGAYGRAGRD